MAAAPLKAVWSLFPLHDVAAHRAPVSNFKMCSTFFFLQNDGGLPWKVVAMVTPGAGGEDSDSMTTDSHSPPSPWPPFIVCPVVSAATANRGAAPLTLWEFRVGVKLKTSIRPLDGVSHNG